MFARLKNFLGSFLFILLAAAIAQATSITISSYQVTNWQYGGSTAKLRIYSDQSFITSDGKTIIAGNPNTTGGFYKEVAITISGTTATIPSFTIDSTNDGQNLTSARYTAVFFSSSNSRLGSFSPFTQFFVTTEGGTTQTWTSIASYNFTGAAPPDLRYTFDDATIQRMIASVSTSLTNPMTTLGDTIYGASGGTPTRLAIGTGGQFYKVASGIPSWATLGASDIAELLSVTQLTDYSATSGTGTTALRTTITSPTTNQVISWNGSNWVNATISAGAGTITSINADATAAQTFTVNGSTFPGLTITDNAAGDHKFGLSGALGVAIGGTSFASYTAGDFIYATGTTTLAKRGIGTTGYPLIVSGGLPTWGQLDLTVGVTGILPVANGGTNNAFFTVSGPTGSAKTYTFPNANATILTDQAAVTPTQGGTGIASYTTGDILYASATNTLAKRGIGTTNQSLMVISGVPSWSTIDVGTSAITGVLPFANGGFGQAGLTAGYVKSTGSAYTSVTVPIPIADGGSNSTGGSFNSFGALYYTGTAYGTSNAGTTGTLLAGNTTSAPAFTPTPTITSLTLSGLTQNSVLFAGASGLVSQNNMRFTWDNSNFRLAVQDTIRLLGSSSGFVGLKAAANAGGTTYTAPSSDGTVNQVLSTDGAGTLFWATVIGGGSGITSLNGLTTSTQTITIATTGATSPTIDQPTSSQNRIIIPLASASNTSGLVTNASQTLSGAKTLDAVLTLANGTTSNPPLLFTCSGCAVTTTPQNGAFETNGQFLYYTQSVPSTARKTIAYTDTSITDGQLSANVQLKTERNANNGYAGLNSSGFVALAQGGLGTGLTIGAAGTFIRSDGSTVAFSTDGSALTSLNASNISSGTLSNSRLSGVELTANKGTADGYASLNGSTKVPVAQISEVLSIADTTTYNGVSGSGTTAIAATVTAPADTQYLKYDSATNNWINANLPASSFHNLLDGNVHPDTIAQTVTRGAIVYGNSTPKWASLPIGAANKSLISDGTDISWNFVDINNGTTANLVATRGGTGLTSGTSGGILYFSSSTTIASSAVLAANAMVVGGGAGTAPSTISQITANTSGDLTVAPAVRTTGSPNLFTVTGPAHTTLTASTEATDVLLGLNRTVQFSTGALTNQRAVYIRKPTYAFVGASTLSTAATVAIEGQPVAGTNATISNSYAFRVETGDVVFGNPASGVYVLYQGPGGTGTGNFIVRGGGQIFAGALNSDTAVTIAGGAYGLNISGSYAAIQLNTNAGGTLGTVHSDVLSARTANATLSNVVDPGVTFTNTGSSGTVTLTLPASPALGNKYRFVVSTNQTFTIAANTSQTIRNGASVSSSAGTITSNTVGNVVEIEYVDTNKWYVLYIIGTWTLT